MRTWLLGSAAAHDQAGSSTKLSVVSGGEKRWSDPVGERGLKLLGIYKKRKFKTKGYVGRKWYNTAGRTVELKRLTMTRLNCVCCWRFRSTAVLGWSSSLG